MEQTNAYPNIKKFDRYYKRVAALFKDNAEINDVYIFNIKVASQNNLIFEVYSEEKPTSLYYKLNLSRIIGDDTLYADDCVWMGKTRRGVKEFGVREIPQWVKEGKPSPTGRHTFTTWRHWSKEDDLLPSGLIGPVMLRGGVIAK